jgi:hypothetical protein
MNVRQATIEASKSDGVQRSSSASARRPPWRVIERLADNARQDREPWRLE